MPLKTGSIRRRPPPSYDEVPLMRWWLDWHRDGLILNCEGLDDERLRRRAVPPSDLSLLGLLRHMTVLERVYWRQIFLGDTSVDALWGDRDFADVDDADVASCFG